MHQSIGIMQGRLLPKVENRYQTFPGENWEKEFAIASELKLNTIEFILDEYSFSTNPLMCDDGLKKIKQATINTNVFIKSICADYFMNHPIHLNDKKKNIEVFSKLFKSADFLGVKDIVIPCVDNSSIKLEKNKLDFIKKIEHLINDAEKYKINLALETDLNPEEYSKLLEVLNSKNITVNYDIGNSASLNYNIDEEFHAYGHKISNIHIKDREINGGPVVLGSGNADFDQYFKSLIKYGVNPNIFIFQAYRDDQGVDIFEKQFKWYNRLLSKYKISQNE